MRRFYTRRGTVPHSASFQIGTRPPCTSSAMTSHSTERGNPSGERAVRESRFLASASGTVGVQVDWYLQPGAQSAADRRPALALAVVADQADEDHGRIHFILDIALLPVTQ